MVQNLFRLNIYILKASTADKQTGCRPIESRDYGS